MINDDVTNRNQLTVYTFLPHNILL